MLDALVLQGAVDVIGAEVQSHRRGVLAEDDPVRLDVGKIVEQESRRRDRAQAVGGGRLAGDQAARPHLVGEGHEGQEAPGHVLLLAEPEQVVHPLGHRLHVAVEHGRVGLDPQGVRDAVDLAPALGVGLARVAQLPGQPGREDLRAAAGHGLQPRRLQPGQRFLGLDLPAAPEVVDLGGREGLDLHVRMGGVDGADDPLVVLERPVRMMAAHDVDLAHLVADHGHHVLDGVLVGAGRALLAGEVAEGAGEHADVGGRDVAVDDEVDAVALAPGLDVVGQAAEPEQVVRREQREPILAAQDARRPEPCPRSAPDPYR